MKSAAEKCTKMFTSLLGFYSFYGQPNIPKTCKDMKSGANSTESILLIPQYQRAFKVNRRESGY